MGGKREKEYARTREAHCKRAEARKDRHQTIPKRSALFLFFACKEESQGKKSKPKRNKRTGSLKSHTQPDGEFVKNLVSVATPELGGAGAFPSTPTPS